MVEKSTITLIKEYLSILKKEGIFIEKAILYGSYAKGNLNLESDIDLLLVSKNFDESDDQTIGKIWYLTHKISSKIEPFVISSHRFQFDEISPIIEIAKKEGLEII